MIDVEGDLWTYLPDKSLISYQVARVVTTNCTVRKSSSGSPINVMGGGCAKEAAALFPTLPMVHGKSIRRIGSRTVPYFPQSLGSDQYNWIVCMPTKFEVADPSVPALVRTGAIEMIKLADLFDWKLVVVPRPGAGLGGLSYQRDVRPLIRNIWDDRFHVITFPSDG